MKKTSLLKYFRRFLQRIEWKEHSEGQYGKLIHDHCVVDTFLHSGLPSRRTAGRRFFQEYGRAFHYFQIVGLKVGQFFTDQDGQWLVRTSVIGLMKDNMLYH